MRHHTSLATAEIVAPVVPGDQGRAVTAERARVLRADGSAIEGSTPPATARRRDGHTYPGPGGTLGPALTFGHLAALDLVRVSTGSTTEE